MYAIFYNNKIGTIMFEYCNECRQFVTTFRTDSIYLTEKETVLEELITDVYECDHHRLNRKFLDIRNVEIKDIFKYKRSKSSEPN